MDCPQLLEKCIAEAVEPPTREIDTLVKLESDNDQSSISVDSENASDLSMIYKSESQSKSDWVASSSFYREMPSRGKFSCFHEADIEYDIMARSPQEEKDFRSIDSYQSKCPDDLFQSNHYDNFTTSDNNDRPRDHPMYQKATVGVDGLYHCPWEKEPTCNHRPEKLKCNYDKYVDSHLKPYRCKLAECENARFSSTACLLRHEREVHFLHGHGEKPFLCTHDGCERGVPGNGFPRHWNLCDHIKRVHNRSPSPLSRTVKPSKVSKKRNKSVEERGSNMNPPATSSGSLKKARIPTRSLNFSEQYQQEHRQLLLELIDISDTANVEKMADKVEKAANWLKLMADTTRQMKSMPRKLQGREKGADDVSIDGEYVTTKSEKGKKAQNKYQATVEDDDD